MNKTRICTILLAALCLTASVAWADTSEDLALTSQRAMGALATIKGKYVSDLGNREISEMATCIRADGVFMTMGLPVDVRTAGLEDLRLVMPGIGGAEHKAELLGIDPRTAIAFVKTTDGGSFKPIAFAGRTSVKPGQRVTSAGLTGADYGHKVSVGVAYVSTELRTPGRLLLVTGGNLTSIGSPVFSGPGPAIGIVGRNQPFRTHDTLTSQGVKSVMLRTRDESVAFTPVEEFVFSFAFPPKGKWERRMPWLGIKDLEGISTATRIASGLKAPGAVVGTVFDGQPADKAGIKTSDIITSINNKPLERMGTPELTAKNAWIQIMRLAPDKPISLSLVRGTKKVNVTLQPVPYPTRASEAPRWIDKEMIGIAVREKVMLDEFMMPLTEQARTPGLVVLFVIRDGQAFNSGLQRGDIITTLDGRAVRKIDPFKKAVTDAVTASRSLNMVVNRKGQAKSLTVLPPKKKTR